MFRGDLLSGRALGSWFGGTLGWKLRGISDRMLNGGRMLRGNFGMVLRGALGRSTRMLAGAFGKICSGTFGRTLGGALERIS